MYIQSDFAAVYSRNVGRVYRICYLRLKNTADAEDACQNVFLRYLRHKKQFRDEEHEKAYFIVCAQNESKNVLKSYWRSHWTSMEEQSEPVCSDDGSPCDDITEFLLALPEKYSEVLYLYYYEGYSAKEIASLLHRSESAVRTQLARGRRLLKADLEGNI